MKKLIFLFSICFLLSGGSTYAYSFTSYPGVCSGDGFGRLTELNSSGQLTYSACTNPAGVVPIDGWDIFTNNCGSSRAGCGDAYCGTATGDATPTAPPSRMCVTARTNGPNPILSDDRWRWTCLGPSHREECSNRKLFETLAGCRDHKSPNEICLAVTGGYRKYYDTGAKCGADKADFNEAATCQNAGSVGGNTVYKLCYTAHSITCGAPFPSCDAQLIPISEVTNTDGSKDVTFRITYVGVKTLQFNPGNNVNPAVTITYSGQVVGPYHYVYDAASGGLTQYTANLTYVTIRGDNGAYYKQDCGTGKVSVVTVGRPVCSVTGLTASPNAFSGVTQGTVNFFAAGQNVLWNFMDFGDGSNSAVPTADRPSSSPEYPNHGYTISGNVASQSFTARVTGIHVIDGTPCGTASANVAFGGIPPSISCTLTPTKGFSPLAVRATATNPTGGVRAPYSINIDNTGFRPVNLDSAFYGTIYSLVSRPFEVVARGTLPTGGTINSLPCRGNVSIPKSSDGGEVSP